MSSIVLPRRHYSQPQAVAQIDRTNSLSNGLVSFITMHGGVSEPVEDSLGNDILWSKNFASVVMSPALSGSTNTQINVGTANPYGVAAYVTIDPVSLNAGDVTCLSYIDIGQLNVDVGIVSLDGSPWSWLDTDGTQLRISAYTAYDTINPISSPGEYLVGLIWRKNNTWQTIFNGEYSASGTATRRPITSTTAQTSRGAFNEPLWARGTSGNRSTPHWWGLWSRSLSEAETMQMYTNPWQIFKVSE